MSVDGAHHVTGLETGCGVDRHCHRGALGQPHRNMLGLEYPLPGCFVCRNHGLSGRQFLCGHESRFDEQFFQPRKPVFVIGMAEIINRMLAFSGMASHVDVPFAQRPKRKGKAKHALFPFSVKYRLFAFGFRVDRTKAMHASEIMRAVHPFLLRSLGVFAVSTPIIVLRVTRAASSSSLQPSVPSGRAGKTRNRISEVESHTRISMSSPSSVPNSFNTPRASATARARYGADLYQTGGRPSTGHG